MSDDRRTRLKRWIESAETRLHPITLPQRELWEASPVPVGDVSNHICSLIELRGAISPKECQAAVQRVVERQEVLRLSFLPGKGQPVQMVRASTEAVFRFREMEPAHRRPGALDELISGTFTEPFDLVLGPLYRVEMFERGPGDWVLAFAIHHAIADGWALGVFVQDLAAAYVLGLRGTREGLPPVPLSYTAWGAAENAFWQPRELEPRAAYWKSRLAGSPRLWSPQPGPGETMQSMRLRVPAEIARGSRVLARQSGATLFSTLLSAFQFALSRWTGADDIVVGTPVANRNRQAVRETMGYCAGIVVLRGQIDRSRPFSDALKSVHQSTVDSFANAMPFAELVRTLGEAPSPGHNPVYQVRFALQNHPMPDVALPNLSVRGKIHSTGTARFDLGCEITEDGESFEVVWLFRPNLFPQTEIENLDRLFRTTLANAIRSPASPPAALTP